MRPLRLTVLVTLSALAAACGSSNNGASSGQPPPGPYPPGQQPPSVSPQPTAPGANPNTLPALMNPRDAQGRIIYRSNTGCFVDVPRPPPVPGLRPPVQAEDDFTRYTADVACPAAMTSDPAWLGCEGSEIYLESVQPAPTCVCTSKSLPPPPPRPVACPALPTP